MREKRLGRSLALPKTKFFNGLLENRPAEIAGEQDRIVSHLRQLSFLLVLSSVLTAGGCAKVRRGLDWIRYENRLSLFATPLYRIPPGFSSTYHRHLYGNEKLCCDSEQSETFPMEKGSGAFFPNQVFPSKFDYDPSKFDYDPMSGPEIVRPTVPVGKVDRGIQQAIDTRKRNLLR